MEDTIFIQYKELENSIITIDEYKTYIAGFFIDGNFEELHKYIEKGFIVQIQGNYVKLRGRKILFEEIILDEISEADITFIVRNYRFSSRSELLDEVGKYVNSGIAKGSTILEIYEEVYLDWCSPSEEEKKLANQDEFTIFTDEQINFNKQAVTSRLKQLEIPF